MLVVSRATVTAPLAPPPVKPVPAVTDSMSPLVAITDQTEPVHTYIAAKTELKYSAPTRSVLPSLSTVGGVDLAPR